MSRLLILLLLHRFDYALGCSISLERMFEGSKEGYYERLDASSQVWREGLRDVKRWFD